MRGKTCIVTAASGEIGLAVALRLARAGANIVACARHDEPLAPVVSQIEALGVSCEPAVGDVGRPEFARQLVELATQRFGRVDLLVNSAAWTVLQAVDSTGPAEFERMLATNVGAVFYLTRAVLPVMRAQKDGVIINVCFAAVPRAAPGSAVGAACAAWVSRFCQAAAEETWPHGIRIYAIAADEERFSPRCGTADAICRSALDPEDIAGLVETLCDQRATCASGQTVVVRRRPLGS